MRYLFWLSWLLVPVAARAADWTVGPGGELPFDWAQYEAPKGEFRAAKNGVIYRAPLETGTFGLRGRKTSDVPWSEERVTVVPARVEVKWLGGADKWSAETDVMTGGLPYSEYQAAWRVIFPTQSDPEKSLPIGRVALHGDARNEPQKAGKPPRLIFDAPTKGRFVSGDLLYQSFFLELGAGHATIVQRDEQGSEFDTAPYFVYGRPAPVAYRMLFSNFNGSTEAKAVRGQKIGYYADKAYVMRWDKTRRDWVSVVVADKDAAWKKIAPLFGFEPPVVTSLSGVYRSRLTQRFNRDYLLDGLGVGVVLRSLNKSTESENYYVPPAPDFDGRLRAPATAPAFPVFSRSHVAAMLRDIERGDNAALLRVGLLSGHFNTPLAPKNALEMVNDQLKSQAVLSRRWLQLQRLRAWGAWHAPHGGGAAMAVYAGVFGRSRDLIARGQSELLGRLVEDWQSLVTGPYYQNAHIWGTPADDANVAALEAFLRLGLARQASTFDNDSARYVYPENLHVKRVEKLERDPAVAHNFWFYLGAGEILADSPQLANSSKALELLEKARALAPNEPKILRRLYRDFDNAFYWRLDATPRMPKDVDEADTRIAFDHLAIEKLEPEKRAQLEKIVADWRAQREAEKAVIRRRWIALTRERIARLGTGYDLLYRRLTSYGDELDAASLQVWQTMAAKAPGDEVTSVAKELLTRQRYDADFDLKNSPAQDENTSPSYAVRRAQNERERELDRALREQGAKLLERYLAAPRERAPQWEFAARLQLARFYLRERRSHAAALVVAAIAPSGAEFDDYRAAKKWIAKLLS